MSYRFNLRMLLGITALVAVAAGFYSAGHQQGEHERMRLQVDLMNYERVVSKPIDIQIQIVDAQSQDPIKNATVNMTLVSGWRDGRFTTYVTDANGMFTTSEALCVGNCQIEILPPPNSVYVARTYLFSRDDMLTINKDGTYSQNTFSVEHDSNPKNDAK